MYNFIFIVLHKNFISRNNTDTKNIYMEKIIRENKLTFPLYFLSESMGNLLTFSSVSLNVLYITHIMDSLGKSNMLSFLKVTNIV